MADLMMIVNGANVLFQKAMKEFKTWLSMIPLLKKASLRDFLLPGTDFRSLIASQTHDLPHPFGPASTTAFGSSLRSNELIARKLTIAMRFSCIEVLAVARDISRSAYLPD